ncbi:MAG: hypothetical protein JNL32_05490 [Candidatus Kapabacteria bacterium]|nr:hypothetical protein [Candidatus Kapabacteria bacterium]
MKTASDDVFVLIKSLSPLEKRYFKVVTGMTEEGKGKDYHALFDCIDKMDEYDEESIVLKYPDTKFSKNLPVAKKYLFDILMRSLVDYHSANTAAHDVRYKIRGAQILRERNMHDLANKQLVSAKKLAEKHEGHIFLLQILQQDARTVGNLSDDVITDKLNSFEQLLGEYLHLIEFDTKFVLLYFRSLTLFRQIRYVRTDDDRTRLEELLTHPLLKETPDTAVPGHLITHHAILSRIYFMLGDYEASYVNHKICVEQWEAHPEKIERGVGDYAGALVNFATRCIKTHRYDEFRIAVNKFKALTDSSVRIRMIGYEAVHPLDLMYAIQTGQFELIDGVISAIASDQHYFKQHSIPFSSANINFSILNVLVVLERYDEALRYANMILNTTGIESELLTFTKLITLIIHIELGNIDLVEYNVRSLYRHLRKTKRMLHFEEIFLKYVRKFTVASDNKKFVALLRQMHAELYDISRNPYEARAFEYFDMLSWLESKIEGIPFSTVIYRRAQQPAG